MKEKWKSFQKSPENVPFSNNSGLCVSQLSEVELIESIREWLGDMTPPSPGGIGDDCAVTLMEREEKYLLTTVDGVAWTEHFDATVPAYFAGRKLMARNLSDIASMGGTPRRAVVSLWMNAAVKLEWLKDFYQGIADLAKAFDVSIVGGDVSAAPQDVFIADLCLQGMSDRPLLRKEVATGDSIWVTGSLGGSILGKHAQFTPRVTEGLWLKTTGFAKSMMDVSDGLAKDLRSLVGDHQVSLDTLPISECALELAKSSGKASLDHAMCDGEDYELVFIADAGANEAALLAEWEREFSIPLTRIGVVGEASEYSLVLRLENEESKTFHKGGYEHF